MNVQCLILNPRNVIKFKIFKKNSRMTSVPTTSAVPENAVPPVEQMMEEISTGTETLRLEQRLESLKDADRKIGDLMGIVAEVMGSLDKEKPISKAKMEDLYKKYELKLDEIQRGIGEQLTYMEQVCVGAEHQGSNFHAKQVAENSEKRVHSLHSQLGNIRDQCWPAADEAENATRVEEEDTHMMES